MIFFEHRSFLWKSIKNWSASYVWCLAALMVMTIGVPLIFAYAETPAEKLERLRKELEDIKSNISAVENSKEKSEQTKQYYQAQANNLKARLPPSRRTSRPNSRALS